MKIDLRKLYSLASVDVDGTITFPEEKLKSAGIIRLEDVNVHGKAIINYEDEIDGGKFVQHTTLRYEMEIQTL